MVMCRDDVDAEDAQFLAGAASMLMVALVCMLLALSQSWVISWEHCEPGDGSCTAIDVGMP
jgi:hypothetical protein